MKIKIFPEIDSGMYYLYDLFFASYKWKVIFFVCIRIFSLHVCGLRLVDALCERYRASTKVKVIKIDAVVMAFKEVSQYIFMFSVDQHSDFPNRFANTAKVRRLQTGGLGINSHKVIVILERNMNLDNLFN